jgi:hypothetical protein
MKETAEFGSNVERDRGFYSALGFGTLYRQPDDLAE